MGAPDFIVRWSLANEVRRPEYPPIMTAFRFIALSASCLALASCDNTKKSGSSDPYASNYGNDGHYNPYPGQSGYAAPSAPKYQMPPAPAAPVQPASAFAMVVLLDQPASGSIALRTPHAGPGEIGWRVPPMQAATLGVWSERMTKSNPTEAQARILEEGLPDVLAQRLALGR